jgi:hypothetical protein
MKKKPPSTEQLLHDLLKLHIPDDYVLFFNLVEVRSKSDCHELILYEKEELIPDELKEQEDIVLDGFCNPINILSHAFSLKKIYLVVYRRRWKRAGTDQHYSNTYDLYPEGAKITRDLAAFLKGWDRIAPRKH